MHIAGWGHTRGDVAHCLRNGADVVWGCATAATHNVHKACLREFTQIACSDGRGFIIPVGEGSVVSDESRARERAREIDR